MRAGKIYALFVAGAFAAGVLGCSGEASALPEEKTKTAVQMPSGRTGVEEEGTVHLVVTYQTTGESVTEDLALVTEAINEITVPEIGVEVEFWTVDAAEAFSEYPLQISQGEQIDLMMLNYQDITRYISRGMVWPLDELLCAHGEAILSLVEEGEYVTEGAIRDGRAYGVSIVPEVTGSGVGFWVPLSLFEKTGFSCEESHVWSMEELSAFWEACKELYPDKYPAGQITTGNTWSSISYYGAEWEAFGTDTATGVLGADGRIVDFYETEEYYAFLQYMRKWYEAGYIYPDAAFTDAGLFELIAEKIVLSYPYVSTPNDTAQSLFGEEAVCLRTSKPEVSHRHSRSGFWVIPKTSANPEAAMEFLNLMYEDARIGNLIQYGIAGKHYVVLDVENGRISLPYGVSKSTTGYYNPLGLYGDRRKLYTFDSAEMIKKRQAYSAEASENRKPLCDFSYSTDKVNVQVDAVSGVVAQYVPVLESGSVDPDVYYPEFIRQLRLAGMDEILADKQRQYEEWQEERRMRSEGNEADD